MLKISKDNSLKGQNQAKLITFIVANAMGLTILFLGLAHAAELFQGSTKLVAMNIARLVGLPAIASLGLGLLNWAIPKEWKEAMVFWRSGVRRMPSSEAFTRIAPADYRIDLATLSRSLGTLPTDCAKQSALWYGTYRKHTKELAVMDANGAYLLYREMIGIVPILLIAVPVIGFIVNVTWPRIAVACLIVISEYLLIVAAGRNAGCRLVANVLAIECGNQKPIKARAVSTSSARPKKIEPRASVPRKADAIKPESELE